MRSRKNAVPVPVTRDLLQEKQTEVARLARQASEAVDIVTRTMNELEGINQQIDNDLESLQNFCLRFDSVAPKKPSSIYKKGCVCHKEVPGYRSVIQSDQRQRRPAPGMWRKP